VISGDSARTSAQANSFAIDAIASKVRSETDRAKRVGLYREMGKILNEGYHAITVAAVPALYAYNPKRIACAPGCAPWRLAMAKGAMASGWRARGWPCRRRWWRRWGLICP
jgi:hypothetical protein